MGARRGRSGREPRSGSGPSKLIPADSVDASANLHERTVTSFGNEWARFDQSRTTEVELRRLFSEYFDIFPWDRLPRDARGADIGCGSGRWARLVAGRVAQLHCVDASEEAIAVARQNLSSLENLVFHRASVDSLPFENDSLDFAYSLGVLHHVPDTARALAACVRKLKRGAPFLVYLYYAFDNRPRWYRFLWRVSDGSRRVISRLPPRVRDAVCDGLAAIVYWPFARLARLASRAGLPVSGFPLCLYRDRSFYSMRTDSRDRFGTPLEKRFRAEEIRDMMVGAGLAGIRFSNSPPYWCAVGFRS